MGASRVLTELGLRLRACLVPRLRYFALVICFVSPGLGRSSGIRHRNQLLAKAWGKALPELGTIRA